MGLDGLHQDNLPSECLKTEQKYHIGGKHEDKLLLTGQTPHPPHTLHLANDSVP